MSAEEIDPRLAPEELLTRYGDHVWRVALRLTGNATDAEDVVQETLIKILRKAHTFRGDSDPMGWIYRIAMNEAREVHRRRKRRPAVSLDELPLDFSGGHGPQGVAPVPPTPEDGPIAAELDARVRAAIAELPDGYREAIVLKDLEGLEYKVAANLMELTLGAFKTRLHRARLHLRNRLQAFWDAQEAVEGGAA